MLIQGLIELALHLRIVTKPLTTPLVPHILIGSLSKLEDYPILSQLDLQQLARLGKYLSIAMKSTILEELTSGRTHVFSVQVTISVSEFIAFYDPHVAPSITLSPSGPVNPSTPPSKPSIKSCLLPLQP
jgi:hypothetical protein